MEEIVDILSEDKKCEKIVELNVKVKGQSRLLSLACSDGDYDLTADLGSSSELEQLLLGTTNVSYLVSHINSNHYQRNIHVLN